MSPGDFYSAVYSTARNLGANDVQARLAAAQASEETGFGQHMVGGNLFGIKAGTSYTGPSVSASTEEEYNGNTVRENANFRAYNSLEESVKDYLGMIQSNFPDAWSAPTFSEAVEGLNSGVYGKYATRAAYAQHVKAIDNKYGALQYAQNPEDVPTPYGPNDFVDLAGLPNDVIPVADQNFVSSDPALAYAQNPDNIPTPFSPDQLAPADTQGAIAGPVDNMPGHWGLNPDVAPVPYETFNQWDAMANAPPVQAPSQGLLSTPSQGLLAADLQNFAEGMNAQRQTIPQQSMPTLNNFADLANAGPMGGDFAAPQDRFAGAEPGQSQPFDRYVNTTSYPATVDYGSYPPGSAPMIDTSAVAPNRVQTSAITPGLLGSPADLSNFADAMAAQRATASSVPTDGFSALAAAGPMGGDFASPASRMGLPELAMDQSRFDNLGISVADMDASRFSTPGKTSRIGQPPAMDLARMPGLLDPTTNTQSFLDPIDTGLLAAAPSVQNTGLLNTSPADIASFSDAYAAQRGATSGLLSADFQSLVGNTERQIQDPASQAPMVSPQTEMAVSSVPGQMTPAQIGAYQQMAASAPNITNLSGFTGIWDDGTAYQNAVPSEPAVASLDTVDVPDQPSVADVDVPGPASTSALDQQASTRPAVRSNAMVQNNPSLLSSVKNAINPGTLTGGLLGSLAGPIGTVAGGLLGNSIYSNGGLPGFSPGVVAPTNQIPGGSINIGGIYNGGYAPGTFATANNGATVTAQPNGWTSYTNSMGVTNMISPAGQQSAYFGGLLSHDDEQDQDQDAESEGGFFSGWF